MACYVLMTSTLGTREQRLAVRGTCPNLRSIARRDVSALTYRRPARYGPLGTRQRDAPKLTPRAADLARHCCACAPRVGQHGDDPASRPAHGFSVQASTDDIARRTTRDFRPRLTIRFCPTVEGC